MVSDGVDVAVELKVEVLVVEGVLLIVSEAEAVRVTLGVWLGLADIVSEGEGDALIVIEGDRVSDGVAVGVIVSVWLIVIEGDEVRVGEDVSEEVRVRLIVIEGESVGVALRVTVTDWVNVVVAEGESVGLGLLVSVGDAVGVIVPVGDGLEV
jgi:hypothetical protein